MGLSVLCEKLAEQASREFYSFTLDEPNFVHLLIPRKALKSSLEASAPGDEQPLTERCA